ncbi:MAG: hypothetical protein WC807_12395 [Hyphomicrobium sp.]
MVRPLPPFRMRPLRKPVRAKITPIERFVEEIVTMKPARRSMRTMRLAPAGSLRVLVRQAEISA